MIQKFMRLLSAIAIIAVPLAGYAQTTIAMDDFDAARTFGFGATTTISGSSASGDRPATAPFSISGNACTANNATTTLTSAAINTASFTGISLSFRVAAFSVGSTGNGMDAGDNVVVSIDPGTGTFTPIATLNGNANAYWAYATGNATLTATYSTATTVAPSNGGNRTTDGYSTITVNSLPATSALKVRIALKNDNINERWVIDNVTLTGNPSCTPPATQATATAATSVLTTSFTANWTRGNGDNILVVARANSTTPVAPISGTSYTADPSFGNNTAGFTTGTGNYVVYSGTSASVAITNLASNTQYAYDVYEYSNTGICYNTTPSTQTVTTTCASPMTQASFGTITKTDISVSAALVAGTGGTGRVVKINTVNSFTNMADGADPIVNLAYGSGEQVVYNGTGTNTGTITSLTANTTYYLAVYEYSCSGRLYINPAATTSFITNPPPAMGLQVTSVNTPFVIDFDNTAAGSNTGAFAGVNIDQSNTSGTLNSNAWNISTSAVATSGVTFPTNLTTGKGPTAVAVTAGGFYAYDNGSGNIALLFQASGAFGDPISATLRVQNRTSQTITSANVGYTILARNDQGKSSPFNFYYSQDNTTYSTVSALDYNTSSSTFGSTVLKEYRVTQLTGLSIPPNGYVYLKWFEGASTGTGSVDELGLDDINITFNPTTATASIPAATYESAVFAANAATAGAVTLTGPVTFAGGVVTTTPTNILSFNSTATITGQSATSFISGPLTRNTAATAAITFPVGKNGVYMPVIITPNAATASTYTVELNSSFKGTPNYTSVNAPLASVDATSYFNIDRLAGGAPADITLPYSAAMNNVTDYTKLVVAHNNGSSWDALTSNAPAGDATSGTITATAVNSFSPFAIGTTTVQPLPVKVSGFELSKQNNTAVLNWTLQTTDGGEKAAIERSADGKTFTALNTQSVEKAMSVKQSYTDTNPVQGVNYYRLAVTGSNGIAAYSKVLTATFSKDGNVSIYPNPAQQFIAIDWMDNATPVSVEVCNLTGQLISSKVVTEATHAELPVNNLSNGAYIITWKQGNIVKHQQIQVVH